MRPNVYLAEDTRLERKVALNDCPDGRAVEPPELGRIVAVPKVGGLALPRPKTDYRQVIADSLFLTGDDVAHFELEWWEPVRSCAEGSNGAVSIMNNLALCI